MHCAAYTWLIYNLCQLPVIHMYSICNWIQCVWSRCVASLSSEQERLQLYPKEEDLVLLWLPENTVAYATDDLGFPMKSAHFGCVSKSNVINTAGVLLCMLVLLTLKFRTIFLYFTLQYFFILV